MSKYSDSQYRAQKALVSKVTSIYSQARIYCLPHAKILDLFDKVYASAEWKRASGYVHAYVHGVMSAMASQHYQVLQFGYVQDDGHVYTTDELRDMQGDDWHKFCNSENGAYFYKGHKDRPLF